MVSEKEDLIMKMEGARAELNSALNEVAPEIDIYPTWKLKQVMDHITGWDELVVAALQAHSKKEIPTRVLKHGIDHYNAESVSARKGLSLGESRQAYDSAREKVLQALRDTPDEELLEKFPAPWGGMCTVASAVKIFVSHELEHAKHIRESLKSAGEPA